MVVLLTVVGELELAFGAFDGVWATAAPSAGPKKAEPATAATVAATMAERVRCPDCGPCTGPVTIGRGCTPSGHQKEYSSGSCIMGEDAGASEAAIVVGVKRGCGAVGNGRTALPGRAASISILFEDCGAAALGATGSSDLRQPNVVDVGCAGGADSDSGLDARPSSRLAINLPFPFPFTAYGIDAQEYESPLIRCLSFAITRSQGESITAPSRDVNLVIHDRP